MRYEAEGGDPANAGLQHARVFLEPIKEKHSWITYADLWTLAGVVAIEQMSGPRSSGKVAGAISLMIRFLRREVVCRMARRALTT